MIAAWSPHSFFEVVVWGGVALLLVVFIPMQVVSKLRRMHRRRAARVCRICGYRFIRKDAECTCPACSAKNN